MFSKLTMSLAVTMSLLLAGSAFAQQKQKADSKATAQAQAQAAAKKAEEEKALEAKRIEEAKVAAEKAQTEDSSGAYDYLKSHFSASYHGEFSFTRKDINSANEDDHDIQDLKIMHSPTIVYRPIKNWKILATSEFKYTDAVPRRSFINRHFRSLVMLTRENIMTQAENGVKMDIAVARRIFDRNHGAASSYGNNRINTSLSKKFGDKLSTSLLAQYLANDPAKGKIEATTWKHSLQLVPSFTFQITDKLTYFFNDDISIYTPWHGDTAKSIDISHEMNIGVVTYQFNDKNSAYFQFKYIHSSARPFHTVSDPAGDPLINDSFDYYIGHAYSFTPKLSITGEIGSQVFAAHDGRDFFAKELKYPEIFFFLDYAL